MVGRPLGSKNKPKPDKIAAVPKSGVLEQKEAELQAANKAPKQTGTFRAGRMIGTEWGIYAVSKFSDKNIVLVCVRQSEKAANEVAKELNDVVSNNAAIDVGSVPTGVN